MDILTASVLLGSTLEVTDERYPLDARLLHLNAAQLTLAREYETRVNEYSGYFKLAAGEDKFLLESVDQMDLNDPITPEAVRAIFYTYDFTEPSMGVYVPGGEWIRLRPYHDYVDLITSYPGQDVSEPVGYSEHGNYVHVRPRPTSDALLLVAYSAVPNYIPTGESRLLKMDPYAVIYSAAVTACVWLEDEARMAVYERLFSRHMESFNVMDSTRNDGPGSMSEV